MTRFLTHGRAGTRTKWRAPLASVSALLGLLGLLGPQEALATPGYCVSPSPITTDGLAVTDASLDIDTTHYTSVDCYGIVDTGSSDVATNLAYVNQLRWEQFVAGVKDDISSGSNSTTVDNIQFTLTTGANTGTGLDTFQAWTLSWMDLDTGADPNLPATIDFALQWNGGNQDVFYLFTDVLLPADPTSGAGSIEIKVTNPPANSDLATSHLSAYFGSPTTNPPTPPTPGVPEPATLALLGLGAVGLGMSRRRRRAV